MRGLALRVVALFVLPWAAMGAEIEPDEAAEAIPGMAVIVGESRDGIAQVGFLSGVNTNDSEVSREAADAMGRLDWFGENDRGRMDWIDLRAGAHLMLVTPMILAPGVSAGVSALNDTIEVGVESTIWVLLAGDGAYLGELGVYAKAVPIPLGAFRHFYVHGRLYRIHRFDRDFTTDGRSFGVGGQWEMGKDKRQLGYVQLDISFLKGLNDLKPDHYQMLMPFVNAGVKW